MIPRNSFFFVEACPSSSLIRLIVNCFFTSLLYLFPNLFAVLSLCGIALTLPVCHRPQAATLALRSGAVRSPVTVVPSCGLETRSWRTGRMARHKQECIRLPYTAALASQRAFFVKELPPFTKERNRERVSCFRFQTGLVSSC